LGTTGGMQASIGFSIMGTNVQAIINALSRKTGSDLLSSPRLTVLSGRTAQIVVAQELRYPENYSDIESEVGTASGNQTGSAGVTITAGTPQDFTVRNVGVEMEVTPTVEENQNISLKLEPRVTEFEGFVEYGGTSVAISGGTTVTVPSGFYQPIFSTREVRTEVTVYDGATVVIGGLTREEVKTVNDKVPLLGDIPLLGRLFQSKGETSTKKNLLIFVTANLISPGGSPSGQRLRNVEANSLFQNPIVVTPGGGISREVSE
jgi:general secretion pathway protein D